MSYYQENRPAMGGLADALAMQGRRGDSTLVHMNPMEVRMLETMSPDGRLSINPETGLPEAFKLKDIAAFALPIAASIAFPMLAPSIGLGGLSGVATGAIGAGLGGFGAGLIQGKGVGDSLIQGGLSGLMSYGLGSAFAPAAPGANIPTAAAPVTGLSGADQAAVGSTFDPMMEAVAGLPAAPEPTGFFGRIGNSVTDAAQKPFMQETLSSIAPESYAKAVTAGAAPTYGSVLTAGGSGLLSSGLLAPEEMPYDIAGMDDMDAYYASRVPDLAAGRLRGQAAARGLNYPPSGSTGSQYYGMATSPGGFGTFYAADGGQVPGALGDLPPHVARGLMENPEIGTDAAAFSNLVTGKASGIQTDQISNLDASRRRGQAAARSLNYPLSGGSAADYYSMATSPGGFGTFYAADGGQVPKPYGDPYGPGDPYGGMSNEDESNFGQSSSTGQSSGTPGSVDTSGFMSSLGDPIDIGLGIGNPSPIGMAATLAGLTLGIPGLGPAVAIGRGIAGLMGPSVPGQVSGFGTTQGGPTGIGIGVTGQAVDPSFEAVSDGYGGTDMGGEDSGSGDQGDTGVGHGAGEGTADVGGWAQGGGISSLAYGGEAAPVGFANKAFEGMVPGQGTGMSDDIPFSIEGNQPALLSRDEYVLPADVVSQLGDGSSSAGADMLDNFISQVRQTKYGNTQQPAPVGPQLMTGLMRQGGVV
jgi:hypothetical protein